VVSAPVSAAIAGKALAAACQAGRPGAAADAVSGIVPSFVTAPASTAEASAVLRTCAEHDLAVVPRGSGSRLGWGSPVTRCDVVVDMLGMGAVIEHAAGDLVARVQAGARMSDVAAVLADAGQEIALDVPGTSTIGGVLADALAGPRRLRYGTPRDLLIGITVVRADGTVARSGGKVVKNVAGYDIGKLFTGSAGTLGLITEATFRLHPRPAARAWVTTELPASPGTPFMVGCIVAEVANSPLVPSAVEVGWPAPGAPCRIGVLLEGSAEGVAARADRMASMLAGLFLVGVAIPASGGAGDGGAGPSRARPGSVDASVSPGPPAISASAPGWWRGLPSVVGGGTLVRVSLWVSALSAVLEAIDAAAQETGLSPAVSGSAGAGVLYVTLPPEASADAIARFVALARAAIPAGRGGTVVLTAPEAVRAALAGEGGLAGDVPGLALMRAVKDQFDPGHRMAPGRFPS
jgi:glycolate oxidase FAD binding subunit